MNVVDYIIQSVFNRKGIDDAKSGFDEVQTKADAVMRDIEANAKNRPFVPVDKIKSDAQSAGDAAMGVFGKLPPQITQLFGGAFGQVGKLFAAAFTSPQTAILAAITALVASIKTLVTSVIDGIAEKWKTLAQIVSDNMRAAAESAKSSFDTAMRHIEEGMARLKGEQTRQTGNARAEQGYQDAGAARDREAAIQDAILHGASKEDLRKLEQELDYKRQINEVDKKRNQLDLEEQQIRERMAKRSDAQKELDAQIRSANKEINLAGDAMAEARERAAESDKSLWKQRKARIKEEAEDRAKAAQDVMKANAGIVKEATNKKRQLDEQEKADKARLDAIQRQRESYDLEEDALSKRRANRQAVEAMASAEKERAEQERASAEAAKEQARAEAEKAKAQKDAQRQGLVEQRDAKKDELVKAREDAKNRQNELKRQKDDIEARLKEAQQDAKAQMLTNEDFRKRRKWEKHGGYGGGGVGADGIAGTWDDPKAQKRAERLQDKLNKWAEKGHLGGRLSKEDKAFLDQFNKSKEAAQNAQALAVQRQIWMNKIQEAAEDAAKLEAKILEEVKNLNKAIDLLKAK